MILICFGTRPEYIKVKSIIEHLPQSRVLFTGQHTDLVKNIRVDHRLEIEDSGDQSSNRLNCVVRSILAHTDIFYGIKYVLVQGDTTSAMAMALSAFHHGVKVIHLEAGLRSNNRDDPYPEEMNRLIISRIAAIHLCPTVGNYHNLLNEGIKEGIYVTGNTGLDNVDRSNCRDGDQVLVTLHRRDNHRNMDIWFKMLNVVAKKYKNLEFILPIHPNPAVQRHRHLLDAVTVIEPIPHDRCINLIKRSRFIISDSGGIQEECAFLNKKIIICRKSTERPEVLGRWGLLCPYPEQLGIKVKEILKKKKVNDVCPFGDGKSWEKCVEILNQLK